MSASSDPIEIRSIVIDIQPSASHPHGWIDFRMLLDSKPLDVPVKPGQNRLLRIEGSCSAHTPGGLASLLEQPLSDNAPQIGIGWRLNDRARRGFFRRPGYTRETVEAFEAGIEGLLCDIEAAVT